MSDFLNSVGYGKKTKDKKDEVKESQKTETLSEDEKKNLEEMNKNQENFSDDGFWAKLKKFAKKAGSEVISKVLVLYYTAKDPETPTKAKALIFGALGYFILPLDLIPDAVPIAGFTDDLGLLVTAIAQTMTSIKDEHIKKAEAQFESLFGEKMEISGIIREKAIDKIKEKTGL
jgi:uncharacterized membrane protein YkvA (DUF1232 family)